MMHVIGLCIPYVGVDFRVVLLILLLSLVYIQKNLHDIASYRVHRARNIHMMHVIAVGMCGYLLSALARGN